MTQESKMVSYMFTKFHLAKGTYHISIKSGHVEARLARQVLAVLQTVVQVTSLEVMRNSGSLGTGHVVQVGLVLRQLVHSRLELLGLTIIQNDDLEPIKRVVLGTSSPDRVHHDGILLAATGDKTVDSGHVVTAESQLRPATALGRPHGPDVVQHGRDGDGDLDGEEDPGLDVRLVCCILGRDDAGDTEDKVDDVEDDVEKGGEGDEEVEVALPALPGVGIITIVEVLDSAGLGVALGE
jgi:hypothetical protein